MVTLLRGHSQHFLTNPRPVGPLDNWPIIPEDPWVNPRWTKAKLNGTPAKKFTLFGVAVPPSPRRPRQAPPPPRVKVVIDINALNGPESEPSPAPAEGSLSHKTTTKMVGGENPIEPPETSVVASSRSSQKGAKAFLSLYRADWRNYGV
ncbi:hypothetical protein DL93DRAFT_2078648 [Clavulina sp. PMI_390]|nr:hypothetical protein DL93DRAFT_2078648 [Clavulina sp. PMI_390]